MSASHTATISPASSATNEKDSKKARFTILPGVGLVDLSDPRLGDLAERLAGKVGEQLMLFTARMREGLLAASVAVGLEVLGELMESEVTEVAGPKGRHNADRAAYRHGGEDGSVTLGGRRVEVRRPRVRSVDGAEVHLGSYDTLASVDRPIGVAFGDGGQRCAPPTADAPTIRERRWGEGWPRRRRRRW